MKNTLSTVVLLLFCISSLPALSQTRSYDIVIYGGTSAGVAAAIESSRMGKSVVLIEPSQHLGGLTTGALGATDIGNKQAIGGISREFYQNIKKHYDDPANWVLQTREEYFADRSGRSKEGEDAMWTFEPSAAKKVYQEMMKKEDIDLVMGKRLDRSKGVESRDNRIVKISMESGEVFEGKIFMDATYEGDLLAAAGVTYAIGREDNKEYGETLNGVQASKYNLTLDGRPSRNA